MRVGLKKDIKWNSPGQGYDFILQEHSFYFNKKSTLANKVDLERVNEKINILGMSLYYIFYYQTQQIYDGFLINNIY